MSLAHYEKCDDDEAKSFSDVQIKNFKASLVPPVISTQELNGNSPGNWKLIESSSIKSNNGNSSIKEENEKEKEKVFFNNQQFAALHSRIEAYHTDEDRKKWNNHVDAMRKKAEEARKKLQEAQDAAKSGTE